MRILWFGNNSSGYTSYFCGQGVVPSGMHVWLTWRVRFVGCQHWIVRLEFNALNVLNPSSSPGLWALGFIQLLTLMSTRDKRKRKYLSELGSGRCVRVTTSAPSVSRSSKNWGILNISQTYRPPLPVTAITLLLYMYMMSIPHTKLTDLHCLLRGQLSFFISTWCSYLTWNTHIGLHGLLKGIALFFICR
jgi:hypothetical protein